MNINHRNSCRSLLCALCTIYRVTSYLQLLALLILTCSPNISFLAQPILDNSRSLEKFELGALSLQPPLRKNIFAHGQTWPSFLTFIPSFTNFGDINGFAKLGAQKPLLWVTLEAANWYCWILWVWFRISHQLYLRPYIAPFPRYSFWHIQHWLFGCPSCI